MGNGANNSQVTVGYLFLRVNEVFLVNKMEFVKLKF